MRFFVASAASPPSLLRMTVLSDKLLETKHCLRIISSIGQNTLLANIVLSFVPHPG
jgi:hypothetical protein